MLKLFRNTRILVGIILVLASGLLTSACNGTITANDCSHITVSFDDGGNPSNDGNTTFSAYAGSQLLGQANGYVSSTRSSVTIALNPSQPNGTFIQVIAKSIPVASGGCGAAGAQWFNPGDGRVDPLPGDRLAAYCNLNDGTLVIYLVQDNSIGLYGAKFLYKDLLAAGKAGLSVNKGENGVVSVSTDGKGNFWAAWNGGQFKADGNPNHGFAKGFNCTFPSQG
jgi:hypothetical protein